MNILQTRSDTARRHFFPLPLCRHLCFVFLCFREVTGTEWAEREVFKGGYGWKEAMGEGKGAGSGLW